MIGHSFISYSRIDAEDFALRLYDALTTGTPPVAAWVDQRRVRPGDRWDDKIVEAIRACGCLLFLMTRDSVRSRSNCSEEWSRALRYKKPVVPLLFDVDADPPFGFERRQRIDFTGDFERALSELRGHLEWLGSPLGILDTLQNQLSDALDQLARERDPQKRTRIEQDIAHLEQQIAEQQRIVDDPQAAAERVEESIRRGLERERKPERPVSGLARSKFINPPPGIAPSYFQDRHIETGLIASFLRDHALRLMTVVGRGGVGKTALVCRLLKEIETGEFPEGHGAFQVDGIVYLSANGTRRVTFPNLFNDLSKLLPDNAASQMQELFKDAQITPAEKMRALLAYFREGCIVLLLDNFEDVLNSETRTIKDSELLEALGALLTLPPHGVKVLVTTRIAPWDLAQLEPALQNRLDLDEGLPSPYAENILREMDVDGKVGLSTAPEALLEEARRRTRGYPRALEALFAILSADRNVSLREILDDTDRVLPENVVEKLVGEAFSSLDVTAQRVIQALAVYGSPVTPVAVDYLLQPYLQGVNSSAVLGRLVNMQFVRKESGRYYLHPIDRGYALSRIPRGSQRNLDDPDSFTQIALQRRGANFFKQARKAREDWKTIADLAPQLAEFDLRCASQDYETAAAVLAEIDGNYLALWGHNTKVIELRTMLVDHLTDTRQQEANLYRLADALRCVGEMDRAVSFAQRALEIAEARHDIRATGSHYGNLGLIYYESGEAAKAIELHTKSLQISRSLGDEGAQSSSLNNLANAYADEGNLTGAIECYEQALEISRRYHARRSEGIFLGNLGRAYLDLGDARKAYAYFDEALAIAREINNRVWQAIDTYYLGMTHTRTGMFREGIRSLEEALSISQETQDRRTQSRVLFCLGECHSNLRDLSEAERFYKEGFALKLPSAHFMCAVKLGVVKLEQGDAEEAARWFAEGISICRTLLKRTPTLGDALQFKALAQLGSGESEEALGSLRAGLERSSPKGVVQNLLNDLTQLKRVSSNLKGIDDALAIAHRSIDTA
jgi:tetratricopeptide (TPR) repeat protein